MPDESCRTCGGELISHHLCSECRKPIQYICKICGTMPSQHYHQNCLSINTIDTPNRIQMNTLTIKKSKPKKKNIYDVRNYFSTPNLLLMFNIVGFFILGIATADYFNIYQSQLDNLHFTTNDLSIKKLQQAGGLISNIHENCLGHGEGKWIKVSCPTEKGYVYKATLSMPKELATKLAKGDFSIRSMAIRTNPDGSVVLEYQKNLYPTSFLSS